MSWISTKDKLPGEGQQVFYYFKQTGVARGVYTRAEYGSCFYGPSGWLVGDVTSWQPDEGQPLPEPPEEGD